MSLSKAVSLIRSRGFEIIIALYVWKFLYVYMILILDILDLIPYTEDPRFDYRYSIYVSR